MTLSALKRAVHAFARAQAVPGDPRQAVETLFARDAQIDVVHPFNRLDREAYLTQFLGGLAQSFDGLHRRDDILMGGHYEGGAWVSTHGNYVGAFSSDWLGLKPSGRLEFLRFGEFFRFEDGRVVEAIIFLDIPQLMIATDQWPIKDSPGRDRGYTGFIPGPATQDGLLLQEASADVSETSYRMVTDMLAGLATKDEAWRPYWHPAMMWYGPAAFGSFTGLEAFAGFQVTFENAFELWSGGSAGNGVTKHFTRFGDGTYVCSGGWPSLMCIRKAPFLDQPSQGETLLMRVCDWWRREGDLLMENWVMVDVPDALLQMGVDLFEGHHAVPPGPRAAPGPSALSTV